VEIGAILFSLAMILLVAAYVLQPLVGSGRGGYRDSSRKLSALQAERDRVLDSIQEIDMDHSMGKVSEQDYQRQRQVLAVEGAEILKTIDELQLSPDVEPRGKTPEMELEAAVAELRGKSSVASRELEAAVAETRGKSLAPGLQKAQSASDPSEQVCPTCGELSLHGDRFCSNCGEALEEQVA
jgi:ribosomal protein L32